LISIDVDHFKNYNDFYGHPRGDIALMKLAEILLKVASRSTDLCARIGGEEFVVLMAATDIEGAQLVATSIQKELNEAQIPHENSKLGFLSVSMGLNVTEPNRASLFEAFVQETDEALYAAKATGRNTICIAPSTEASSVNAGSTAEKDEPISEPKESTSEP
jgi:two-component system, chemotaxis family, response regulator WspR